MKTRHWISAVTVVAAGLAAVIAVPAATGKLSLPPTLTRPVADSDNEPKSDDPAAASLNGWVYVMSNQETGNSVIAFKRDAYGNLTQAGVVTTGGLGAGRGYDLEDASDALVSQAALIASKDRQFLFAVDAGSNEVSVLSIKDGGVPKAVARVPSGGIRPVSLALHDDLLYVANAGGLAPNTDGPSATVAGFRVAEDGKLTAIDGSATDLPGGSKTAPSQVAFSPDGKKLLVTERQTQMIDVFPVEADGKLGPVVSNKANGAGPFTVTFHGKDIVISTEVVGNQFKYGAVTTYRLKSDGKLEVITPSLNSTELAACWTAWSIIDPSVYYFTNAQSGTVGAVRIDEAGKLVLFPDDGHIATTRNQHATQDMALSADGRFLYVLTMGFDEKLADPRLPTQVDGSPFSAPASISAWRVEQRGGLTPLPGYGVADDPATVVSPGVLSVSKGGLPPGSQGIVAF
jgi:6-phosphogluconolactonase